MPVGNTLCKLSFLLFTLLGVSCKPHSNQKDLSGNVTAQISLPYHIELEDILKKKGTELLSQVASEISYIPLETHANSLVNRVSRVYYWNGSIIVGEFRKLHLFDKTGRFIKNISRQGGGPGEFNRVNFVVPDPDNGNLYLFDRRTLLKFDRDLKFLGNIQLQGSEGFSRGLLTEDKTFLFYIPNLTRLSGDTTVVNSLIEFDLSGNVIKEYKNENPRYKSSGISLDLGDRPLYKYKNEVRFLELGLDTLYTIKKEEKEPYAIINLGSKKIDYTTIYTNFSESADAIEGYKNRLFHIVDVLEDEQFIYILLDHGLDDIYIYCTFNKMNGDLFLHENNGLTNDLDGGLPFFPKWIDESSGDMIMLKSAEEFKEEILSLDYNTQKTKYGDRFEEVYKLAESLQEDDNPILIVVR